MSTCNYTKRPIRLPGITAPVFEVELDPPAATAPPPCRDGIYHVGSVQCDTSGDASAALADIVAEAERRCRGGHRLDDTATLFLGTRGSVPGECPAARVTTTVTCMESTR